MKSFIRSKKILVIVALFIGVFSLVLLNNNYKKIEEKTIYKDGIKQLDYNQVQVGDDDIDGTTNVKFDAYFLEANSNSEEAGKYRGKIINVSSDAKIWINLGINGGLTLKDAYIEFQNSNVRIEGALAKDTLIGETIVSNNITRIPLNEVSVGTSKLFYLTVKPNLTNNINSYNGTNKIVLKGTVVENNQEIEIEKEVEYIVNFYGDKNSMKGEVERISEIAPMVEYGSEDTVTVTYNFKVKETNDLMLLKSTNIEAKIGQLNGFNPLSVTLSSHEFTYEYDDTTKTLTAKREAEIENDRITKNAYAYREQIQGSNNINYYSVDNASGIVKAGNGTYSDPNSINNATYKKVNDITVTVVYPNEASYKTGTATLNVNVWYEGFNNEELTDAITTSNKTSRLLIANYQCDDTKGTVTTVFTHVTINKDSINSNEESRIDSTPLANAYKDIDSGNIIYYINIAPYVGGYNPAYEIGSLTIYDLDSNYMNQTISMKEFEKYYAIALSSNIMNYIGTQGTVKVIDADTNEIVHVFDKDNYNQTYAFNTDVRSIKLEISDIDDLEAVKTGINNDLFNIMLMKEIDTDYIVNNVSKEDFETWNHVYTTIRTDWTAGEYTSENDVENIADSEGRRVQRVSALFTEGMSRVKLSVDTTDTRNRLEVNIDTLETTSLYKGYKNGEFLIELPDAILDYNVVEDNIKYEKIEKDGHNLLKVIVENTYPDRYNLTFHIDVVPDVRVVNETIFYRLYAYNPNCHNYYDRAQDKYDINGNNDFEEYVGYDFVGMNLIAPSEVITAASLEEYNTNDDITVSPMIAEVDPTKDSGDAKVKVYVVNNSGYAVKDLKVIGKLAFVGNTSQIDGSSLDSEFNVTMTSSGISIPTELEGNVTIYYSENETPTDDLTDTNNGWTTTPTNFDNVKTYMIVVEDYVMENGASETFEYSINMPTNTENLLKKSYFTHAVYYNMLTEAGTIPLSVGSSKLGISMVRKYDLNIDTLRKSTNKKVDLVKYEIEDEEGNIKTITPSENGLEAKGLYVGKKYKLRQKSISNNYEIDYEIKTFKITNNSQDELEINTTGVYKSSELNDSVLNLTIENRPKITIVLKTTDFDTDENIYGAKYYIYGRELTNYYIANDNGEIILKNIYLNGQYKIYQVSSPNHQRYNDVIDVTVAYDDETGEVKLLSNSGTGEFIETLDDNINYNQPIVNVKVRNHTIPTSTLRITKVDAETNEALPNALYRLTGPNIVGSVFLRTDENGQAEYDVYSIYAGQYSQAGYTFLSDAAGYYTLKEVSAPAGYTIDKNEITFILTDEIACPESGECTTETAIHELKVVYSSGKFKDYSYDETNNIVDVTVADYPLIKITKKDADTGELLPNTMFAINKVSKENGKVILSDAIDSNGNIVGDEVVIDGVTYRVVITNANGEIGFNLEKGQYKLKEVQASSDKYEISNQVYYFGVGETVQYQAAGLNFVEGFNTNDISVPLVITNPSLSYDNVKTGKYQQAKDGGFYYYNQYFLAKYDKNSNLEWIHQNEILTDETSNCFYRGNITITYPDKDPIVEDACFEFYSGIKKIYETDSGDIFIADQGSAYGIVYDENNNPITYYYPYLQLDSSGNISSYFKPTVIFTDRRNITSSDVSSLNKFNRTDNEDEMYTTYYPYYNSWYNTTYTYEATSGRTRVNGYDFNGITSYYIYDIASIDNGYLFLVSGDSDLSQKDGALVKFDENGFVNERIIKNDMQPISNYTVTTTGFNRGTKLLFDSDGNFVVNGYFNFKVSYTINSHNFNNQTESYGLIRLKYDKNLNLIYAKSTPVSDEYGVRISPSNEIIQVNDDGSYFYKATYIETKNEYYDDPDGYTYTNSDYFTLNVNDYSANYFVFEYDEDGNAVKAINVGRSRPAHPNSGYSNTNNYVIKGLEAYYVQGDTSAYKIIPDGDGFIVATCYYPYNYEGYNGVYGVNKVTLANGEKVTITGNYIIYKVNKNSKIEWIKQFNTDYQYYDDTKVYVREDGSILFQLATPITYLKDDDDNYLFGDDTGTQQANILIYKPSDEVLASGPEAYTLNIENEAKKFDIKVTSDEGSTFSVTNADNEEVFNASGTYTSEKVVYDENTTNEITITLLPGHVLKSVKLNGKDFTYQVNDDGTITLDKIPNVKENKTIEIETEEKDYSVVVHHYLENTTERVASDEILSGNYGETYEAMPFVSNLYSLIKDNDGNYIMPSNYTDRFENATEDVIFYYKENDVELDVNYYLDNTENELAPTLVERKLLGSSYTTEPIDIEFYRVSRVLGEESGILNQQRTEVTYFYQEVTSKVTVKHLDINTLEPVAPEEEIEVSRGQEYQTSASTEIPVNYKNVSKTANANSTAEHENIEVIYYYDIIPFNVSVDKRIESIKVNGENITLSDSKSEKITVTNEDEVIVYYEIELKNNGDIKAMFNVVEEDVNNFEIYDLGDFEESEGKYILETTLEAGESKIYKIGYKWKQGKYGISSNEVEVEEVRNELGFDEPDDTDNNSITAILVQDKDVLGERDENPNTSDTIYKSIITFIMSLVGLLFAMFMYMKKKEFN